MPISLKKAGNFKTIYQDHESRCQQKRVRINHTILTRFFVRPAFSLPPIPHSNHQRLIEHWGYLPARTKNQRKRFAPVPFDHFGCDGISTVQTRAAWGIKFYVHNRKVHFAVEHPDKSDGKYSETPSGRRKRNTQSKNKAWEQDLRQIYRALCLIIKAKLEYVASGHAIFEREFMANIVDPVTGKTMGEVVQPLIEDRYEGIDNRPALFLPGPTE